MRLASQCAMASAFKYESPGPGHLYRGYCRPYLISIGQAPSISRSRIYRNVGHATPEPGAVGVVRLEVLAVTAMALVGGGCNAAEKVPGVVVDAERAAIRLSTCCNVDFMLLSTTDWTARSIVAMLGVIVVFEELPLLAASAEI